MRGCFFAEILIKHCLLTFGLKAREYKESWWNRITMESVNFMYTMRY